MPGIPLPSVPAFFYRLEIHTFIFAAIFLAPFSFPLWETNMTICHFLTYIFPEDDKKIKNIKIVINY
mgnify:CR=1 FL=1